MKLMVSLRSEILKTKRTSTWYLFLIAAIIAPVYSFLDSSASYRIHDVMKDPWNIHLMGFGSRLLNMMILPFFLMLTCTMLTQLEYRNHTWKQLFVSPQPLVNVFLSKYIIIQLQLLLVIILSCLFMVVALYSVDCFETNLKLSAHHLDWKLFLIFWGRIYITVLAISAFQFWLALRFKNFIVPIVTGIFLFITAAMMMEDHPWVHDNLLPYIYPLRNCFPKHPSDTTTVVYGSLAYTVLFLVSGCIDFTRRRNRY